MTRRDCSRVISEMIDKIPANKKDIINALLWNYQDAKLKAPEDTVQWLRTHETLRKYIPTPKEEWEFEVYSIFTKRPVEILKVKLGYATKNFQP